MTVVDRFCDWFAERSLIVKIAIFAIDVILGCGFGLIMREMVGREITIAIMTAVLVALIAWSIWMWRRWR